MKKLIGLVFVGLMFFGCGGGGGSSEGTNGTESSSYVLTSPLLIDKSPILLKNAISSDNVYFSNIGGGLSSCSITPSLPSGLKLASNCTIYGVPTVNQAEEVYTVTGTNAEGSASATVTLSVISSVPKMSNITNKILLKQNELATIPSFSNTGSPITSCSISPTLPNGLTVEQNCSIVGQPTVIQTSTTYTVTGTNSAGSDTATITLEISNSLVRVLGKITYDSIPFVSGNVSGLDYSNITPKSVRGVVVEAIDGSNNVIASTITDSLGNYSMNIPQNTSIKIRVSAKLYQEKVPFKGSWDFQVKDNTNSNALYVMEGSMASVNNLTSQTRNLNAGSGWGGASYTSTRVAAPFAILDVVYQAIQKITTAQSDAVFAPLNIFWSKNNISSTSKNVTIGEILTSHFDGTSLFILGKENSDTDEYDVAVVAHEWSHYFEAKFSRSDSIGGSHGGGDMLDIRVAFGEGFATAFSSMIRDNQFYIDTFGTQQASSGVSDIEAGGSRSNSGWYSEASVYSVLYDLYDSNPDTGDTLSLGFIPIYNALIGAEKNTVAFTSIFSFITAIKAENAGNDTAINAITTNENIASITDIYGTGRSKRTQNATPLYTSLSVGGSASIIPNYTATSISASNRLGSYNFITFTIPSLGTYTITASSGSGTNLDFYAYLEGSKTVAITSSLTGSTVSGTATLSVGTYRMQIVDNNLVSGQTFTVTLTQN